MTMEWRCRLQRVNYESQTTTLREAESANSESHATPPAKRADAAWTAGRASLFDALLRFAARQGPVDLRWEAVDADQIEHILNPPTANIVPLRR